ncbi:MAG: SecY-interacting protein [Motiliproteus sp.]
MPTTVDQALDRLVTDFLALYATDDTPMPSTQYDTDWPSDCYQATAEEGITVPWQPIKQKLQHPLFEGLESALETPVHADIKNYYGRYWSDPIPARFRDDELSLLFIWNDKDYERLRANIIGHALNKKKTKQPLTFFFGCTEPDELILSLENSSGKILLEKPGRPPLREIAPSMTDFLNQLTPIKR